MNDTNTFDERAFEWDKHPLIVELSGIFSDEIKKNIPLSSDMDLLEFGCGTGQVSMNLYPSARSFKLIDTSPGMLGVLRQKIKQNNISNMALFCEDIFNLKFEKNQIDFVYSLMAFHHVRDIEQLLKTFHNLLKPGSYLCIGDLEPEDGSFHGDDFEEVHHGFDTAELKNTFEENGFELTKVYRMHIVKKPDKAGRIGEYPIFFMAAKNN
ncbi:MAG: class I SAM-dependent methyltransferase [Deltaproteobacteria bacterium]|nr:class I SAM-dependent methyltransferase [Deltaproteobacteria bacterium]MBW2011839.1 class I SAM-dependent methyltransferase [Deltaproteobacteria bacterium]